MPATSANVTFVCAPSIRRAFERPKLPSAFICPPDARREIHTNSATSRITGPKPRSRLSRKPRPSLTGSASITTSLVCSRLDSCTSSANAGMVVSKFLAGSASRGYRISSLNSPETDCSPVAEILATLPSSTWSVKFGEKGMVTERSWPGANSATVT